MRRFLHFFSIFVFVPPTSNTVSSNMQIAWHQYLQEPRLESGLSGCHAGVFSWMVARPWHPTACRSRSLAFPSRNCHSTGSLALDWAVYPQLSQMGSSSLPFLSGRVMHSNAENILDVRVYHPLCHIFSAARRWGLKRRIDVIFLKGWTFFQLCQPFGRLVPNSDELL